MKASLRTALMGALILRLLLMPVSMHPDLLFVNYFPYFLSYKGVWDVYGYFGDHYLKYGFTYYPPFVYYLTAFAQWAVKMQNPGFDVFMSHVHELIYFEKGASSPFQRYLAPFQVLQSLQFVFWMKWPYLVADALCIWVLLRKPFLTGAGKGGRSLVRAWLFNPVLLFSVYIFGQYRIYSAFFVWLVIYLMRVEKTQWAFFVIGLMGLADNFPLILLLPAALIFGKSWKERMLLLLIAAIPMAFLLIPLAVSSKGYVFYAYASPLVQKLASQGILRHYPEIVGPICKGIFLTSFLFTVFFLTFKKLTRPAAVKPLFVYVSLGLLLVLYATSTSSVHYFMWALPFFLIVRDEGEPWPRTLSGIFVVLLFLFNLDSRGTKLGLLMPLNTDYFMSLLSLHEWVDSYVPWGKLIGLSRVSFSVLCLFFAVRLFVKRISPAFSSGAKPIQKLSHE